MPDHVGIVQAGGGAKCAWQAGVWQYLAEAKVLPHGISFVAGTSGGALNALPAASYPPGPGQATAIARKMGDLWRSVHGARDVYRVRFPPLLAAAWNPSLCKTDPLLAMMKREIDPAQIRRSGVQLRLTGVDLLTGEPTLYTQDHPELLRCALASAAFPVAFPPVKIGNSVVADGGIREAAPLGAAIDHGCERIIVLLPTDPRLPDPLSPEDAGKAVQIGLRVLDLMHAEVVHNDVAICELINRLVDAGCAPDKRTVQVDLLGASSPLGSGSDFSKESILARIEQGYDDAKAHFERT